MTRNELMDIVSQIHKNKTPASITKRTFINALGCEKRTSGNIAYINRWLSEHDLVTEPNYEYGYIDEKIELRFKYKIKSDKFQLYSLYVDEYKNLKKLYIDFEATKQYCCFIGLNGSGKSNILEAISAIFYSLYHIATLTDGARKYPCAFKYKISYILRGEYYEVIDGKLKNGNRITMDILPKNILASYSGEDTRLWKKYFRPIYEKYCSKIISTAGFSVPFMFYVSKYQWEIALLTLLYSEDIDVLNFIKELLGRDIIVKISFEYKVGNIRKWEGSDVEALIDKLREQSEYTVDDFRAVVNNISFIDRESTLFYYLYRCSTESESQIIQKVNILFDGHGDIEGLSEGEKKLIIANTMIHILASKDSLCLFDEPDSHIHVGKKDKLKQLIDSENRYSLITTHSPTFIKHIPDTNIIYLADGKIEDTNRLRLINDLTEGNINYLKGALLLSSVNPIILVEGIGDVNYINKAIELLKDDKYSFKTIDWHILHMGGAGENAIHYINTIKPHIDKNRKVVVVLDRDESGAEAMSKLGIKGGRSNFTTYYDNNWFYTMLPQPINHNCLDITIEDYFSKEYKKKIAIEKIEDSEGHFKKLPKDLRQSVKDSLAKKLDEYTKEEMQGFSILLNKIINILENKESDLKKIGELHE